MKRNPKTLTINFSSLQGTRVRQSYLDVQSMLKANDSQDSREIFGGLHAKSRSFTFRHADGMLSMTQFAQPALVVLELAAFRHMKQLGRVPDDARFAGHSLGEFVALGCLTEAVSLTNLLKTVFIRGTLMQMAVPRDARGRSGFGMAAIDPSRVRKDFSDAELQVLVDAVAGRTGFLLEMVNRNVRGKQYVCAGDNRALDLLRSVTDALHAAPLGADVATLSRQLVDEHVAATGARAVAANVVLQSGKALIPLPGIDVPFHSSCMSAMGALFRQTLLASFNRDLFNANELVGRWIPNVTGRLFSTDKAYVESVAQLTGSPRLTALASGLPD